MFDRMTHRIGVLGIIGIVAACTIFCHGQAGRTEISKWQYAKSGAVSLTYDDGTINQFRVAAPIMDGLGFPATFFIITGDIQGSQYRATFIGRPVKTILADTASVPTNKANFFERASAVAFLGYEGTAQYHTQAGEVYDEDRNLQKAYRLIDEAYAMVRQNALPPAKNREVTAARPNTITWDELRLMAQHGHEFASHTVTHPRLAVLDDANLIYELEKSRQDILDHLGFRHTFSVECPYGTEDERAMRFALARYQVARNLMPDAFVEDLDRASDKDPALSRKEYVRWQRGVLTETPMHVMKSWVDTAAAHDNTWLVLVFHGVDGVGWKPKTGAELKDYLGYIKAKDDKLWVATFQDVTKYIRERMHGTVASYREGGVISVVLQSDLTDISYDLPLTLKTYVPAEWQAVEAQQGQRTKHLSVIREQGAGYVLYQALPNAEVVKLSPSSPTN